MLTTLAKQIDHTLLRPDASTNEITELCRQAKQFGFASVCVNPCHVSLAAFLLRGSDVQVCTVVGFPLGASTTAVKVFETADAIQNGATEIDMVLNIGAAKTGKFDLVSSDIQAVVDAAHPHALVKVILETCLLNEAQKTLACQVAVRVGADFVKTSTGFSSGGATLEDVTLMAAAVAGKARVKASGGIRTRADAEAFIKAGAQRIGTSNGVLFVQDV